MTPLDPRLNKHNSRIVPFYGTDIMTIDLFTELRFHMLEPLEQIIHSIDDALITDVINQKHGK